MNLFEGFEFFNTTSVYLQLHLDGGTGEELREIPTRRVCGSPAVFQPLMSASDDV